MCFNQTEFGQRIKELRKISRMTQEQLSEELNISVEQLRKMECGCRGTSIDLLISIAGYFNVSTDYLLTGTDNTNIYSGKRLESVLRELYRIISDLPENRQQIRTG